MSNLRFAFLTLTSLSAILLLLETVLWPLGLGVLALWYIMLARSAYVTGRAV